MHRYWKPGITIAGLLSLACNLPISCCLDFESNCTRIECHSGVSLKKKVEVDFTELRSSTLTLCRNDGCQSRRFDEFNEAGPNSLSTQVPVPSVPEGTPSGSIYAVLVSPLAEGGFLLNVDYLPMFGRALKDGDFYAVTVQTASGRKLVDVRQTVTYEVLQPNGPSCPPTCRTARLD